MAACRRTHGQATAGRLRYLRSCRLQETLYVCPETCPKGPNGPCGGTRLNRCEFDDRECVHSVKYRIAKSADQLPVLEQALIPCIEAADRQRSSWSAWFMQIREDTRVRRLAARVPLIGPRRSSRCAAIHERIVPFRDPSFVAPQDAATQLADRLPLRILLPYLLAAMSLALAYGASFLLACAGRGRP